MLAVVSFAFGTRCAIHCYELVDNLKGDPCLAAAVTARALLCQARSAGSAAEGKAGGQGLHASLATHTSGLAL